MLLLHCFSSVAGLLQCDIQAEHLQNKMLSNTKTDKTSFRCFIWSVCKANLYNGPTEHPVFLSISTTTFCEGAGQKAEHRHAPPHPLQRCWPVPISNCLAVSHSRYQRHDLILRSTMILCALFSVRYLWYPWAPFHLPVDIWSHCVLKGLIDENHTQYWLPPRYADEKKKQTRSWRWKTEQYISVSTYSLKQRVFNFLYFLHGCIGIKRYWVRSPRHRLRLLP